MSFLKDLALGIMENASRELDRQADRAEKKLSEVGGRLSEERYNTVVEKINEHRRAAESGRQTVEYWRD
jgi:hypothetical protein